MRIRLAWLQWGVLAVACAACSGNNSSQPAASPAAPTPTPTPQVVINAPVPVSPVNGASTSGWPTFTVADAVHTGPASALVYRFDVSTTSTFAAILVTGTVSETPGQTSFTPPSSQAAPPQTQLYWRAVAIDPVNIAASPASTVQSFTALAPPSAAAKMAAQLGVVLWPGAQPTGTNGQAVMGDGCDGSPNWGSASCYSPGTGQNFQAPTVEALRYFDLFDRGYDPQSAINWMQSNGYPTVAMWYPPPEKAVLGFGSFYLAARNKYLGPGEIWDIVIGMG